jgi:hypothetical protein
MVGRRHGGATHTHTHSQTRTACGDCSRLLRLSFLFRDVCHLAKDTVSTTQFDTARCPTASCHRRRRCLGRGRGRGGIFNALHGARRAEPVALGDDGNPETPLVHRDFAGFANDDLVDE